MATPEQKLLFDRTEIMSEEQKEEFVIDSDAKANWALRKIKRLKKKQKENEEFAASEIEKIEEEIKEIKDWRDSENEKLQRNIDYFENLLHNYAMQLRKEDPDLKTYKLPFGQLQFRAQRPKWKYDEERLLESVKKTDLGLTCIDIIEKVNKNALKKSDLIEVVGNKIVIKDTGEVLDGVLVENRPEQFFVKVKEG